MKILAWLLLLPLGVVAIQTLDLHQIRVLYHLAVESKEGALQLNRLMLQVDTSALPVLVCYKGANEIIQAKYSVNPITKLDKFNKGKALIQKAFNRDTLSLEIRFIRYSIQSNLPAFLGYRNELDKDKQFLLNNTKASNDPELQAIIFKYLELIN